MCRRSAPVPAGRDRVARTWSARPAGLDAVTRDGLQVALGGKRRDAGRHDTQVDSHGAPHPACRRRTISVIQMGTNGDVQLGGVG